MNKLLVILGPTATGKTDLALSLAKKFNGELVSCDSRQVYRGLDVGTGKFPISNFQFPIKKADNFWEIDGIKIWMYDVVDPAIQYTVSDYIKDAGKATEEISKKRKLPIIVGGTGLYLKALIYGLPNLSIPVNKNLRKKLEELTKEQLQKKLKKISPQKWESLNFSDRQNTRRLTRTIELVPMYPYMVTSSYKALDKRFNILMIGLTAPRDSLYRSADLRVLSRINQGMIEEAKRMHKNGLTLNRMRQLGLEYGVLADYLAGMIKSKEELIEKLQGKIHGYIRRQLTWFKKEKNIIWFDIIGKDFSEHVEKMVAKWYHPR